MQQKQNNKYVSCEWVNHGLDLNIGKIRTCCYGYLQDQEEKDSILIKDYNGENINWEEVLEKTKERRELHKKNIFLPSCQGCVYLFENEWDEDFYIDHLTLNHWSKCNCDCTYCYTADDKNKFNSHKHYNILPIIKDMLERNILRLTPRSCIIFGGGEPTILEDFDEVIELLLSKGFKNIRINSSGIKYSKSIEKGLQMGAISLVISPDSGTKETFEKIKRVPCFDTVWGNIQKYSLVQQNDNLLKVKYIIIPGINDNKEEINNWFDLVIKNKIKAISVSVEQHWYFVNTPNFPKDIYEKINYIQDKAKELDLNIEIYVEALSLMKKYKERN